MYCKNCGNKIDDNSKFCKFCGANLQEVEENNIEGESFSETQQNNVNSQPFSETPQNNNEYNPFNSTNQGANNQANSELRPPIEDLVKNYNTSKTWAGFLMGFFFSLIGLVVGFLIYPKNTVARSTFVKGWLWSLGLYIAVVILYAIIIVVATV